MGILNFYLKILEDIKMVILNQKWEESIEKMEKITCLKYRFS